MPCTVLTLDFAPAEEVCGPLLMQHMQVMRAFVCSSHRGVAMSSGSAAFQDCNLRRSQILTAPSEEADAIGVEAEVEADESLADDIIGVMPRKRTACA